MHSEIASALLVPGWAARRRRPWPAAAGLALGVALPAALALYVPLSGRNWVALSLDASFLAVVVAVGQELEAYGLDRAGVGGFVADHPDDPGHHLDRLRPVGTRGAPPPPGGGRAYRATVHVRDPSLDARSLNVSLQSRGGAVNPATARAVEDAILSRARQMRIRDRRL